MSLVERFVVGVDIQSFSSRVARRQVVLQTGLDRMLDEAAWSAGLSRELWTRHPGGDGEVAVLPADVDLLAVVRRFITELDIRLTDHNDDHDPGARIRLRVAMHIDVVTRPGPLGYAGPALTVLQRLLDSEPVRDALAAAPEANLAQIISDSLYRKAVLPELGGLRPRQFRQVRVDLPAKEFHETAYLFVPGESPAPRAERPDGRPQDLSAAWSPLPGFPFVMPALRTERRPPKPRPQRLTFGKESAAGAVEVVEPVEPTPVDLGPGVRQAMREVREALARGEVDLADVLTTRTLLVAVGRDGKGWLRESDGPLLADALLTELDLAWSEFSGGAWGFRAQRARVRGLTLTGPREFRELSVALGWRAEKTETIPLYREFVRRASADASFYPTLRNPERENYPSWHDEWSPTVMAVHVRLQQWER
ncbi:hypothetical protein F4560_003968 [Saccharothrix ecbatanensis]|uniref:GUN4-like domain-containing protein n=1 Tax=Saccharothrix ecbatanensis TaxID=1105145 RepID=A0A7W9HL87_9PSEU|nr:GUN4 domain-containing protein [Saccharothrix ecbatanensis]MBB5804200.1 hypothetical protein [Saccharothrix ecbatanensis]